MIFLNRRDAGKQLAELMISYKSMKNTVVLGLPRGGIIPADEVAKRLALPLDVICSRKMGAPFNEELAIGAITDTGHCYFNSSLIEYAGISEDYIEQIKAKEWAKALRQLATFREGLPKRELSGKTVILVDDGLATGATMKAAIAGVVAEGAEKVVVAVPVSAVDSLDEVRDLVDDVFCVMTPPHLEAIGQFYRDFSQVEDEEVVELLH